MSLPSTVHVVDPRMVHEKRRVALTSVVAAIFLTGFKLGVGLWTGSLGILSEAAHSGLDLLAAGITLIAVRLADRPPDHDHNFGHGKFENLSALAETLLLLLTCVWILFEAWERLTGHTPEIDVNVWSFAVIAGSIVIDIGRSRALSRVARKYNSQALEADALHFRTDIYSSLVVIFGLVSVSMGFPEGDAIAAAIVAGIVIWISIQLGRRTIDVLLDRVPHGLDEKMQQTVASVDGVQHVVSTRVRQSGGTTFADVVVGIDRTATFDQAHRIMDAIEGSVAENFPRTDVVVHAEPVIGRDEDVASSVSWLVQRNGQHAHNISVLQEGDVRHVDLDIEFAPGTSFAEAHAAATAIERDIRSSLPRVGSVHVHMEERASDAINARDVSARESQLLARVREIAELHPHVQSCDTVRCLETSRGLRLTLVCHLAAGLTLPEAHNTVDQVETEISGLDARILKTYIHAEPALDDAVASRA